MDAKEEIEFLREAGKLKATKRMGWVLEGISQPESVADHSFRIALMALVFGLSRKDLDVDKAIKMALIHDLAECETGDILVDWKMEWHKKAGKDKDLGGNHGITQEQKVALERKAMEALVKKTAKGKEILALWEEFEEGKTREAAFVKSLDRLEMFLQALEYEQSLKVDLSHWFYSFRNVMPDQQVREAFKEILRLRKK